jgi:uncharacterized protein YggE
MLSLLLLSTTASAQPDTPPHVIKVKGEAEIKALPDKAIIVIGVQSRDSVMSIARSDNDNMTRKAIRIAKKYGVADDDISTEYYTVEPHYRDYNKLEFLGYLVKRRIVIDLKRFSGFQDLMDEFLREGIENVQSIQFKINDPDKYTEQALAGALKKATAKAKMIALEMGVKIGKVYSMEESYGGGLRSPNFGWGYPPGEGVMHSRASLMSPEDESTTFGYLNATASVVVSFEIE